MTSAHATQKPNGELAPSPGVLAEAGLSGIDLLDALQAVRVGDFSVRLPSHRTGIEGKIADVFNEIVAANQRMAQQLEYAGEVVGRQGQTRHRVKFGLSAGAWGEMEQSVNTLIDDLLWPTREVTRAISAVAKGDLLQTVPLEVDGRPLEGEFLRAASIVNTMIKQLSVFTSEVTRVAREVGTDGKLGGQAQVREVTGVWKDLTESVNSMASNLTAQVRNIAEVTIAVANGDLSKKITVDVRGEILQLKEAINTMVDQLRSFASEVTRVAREVGTEGKLGGQAVVPGVAGTWKDLTDSVNAMCGNLTDQVRNIAQVTTAVARGDLSRKITVDVRGEILELKDTINTMVDQLNAFASEVTRVAREVGTEGRLGGQAQVLGVAGTWKDLTDNVNSMASNLTGQVRNIAEVATAIARGDLSKKITVNVSGEILQLKETINTMVDQLNAFASEVTRVAREVGTDGRLGGQANVLGVAGTWKDLTESVNSMASNLTAQVRNIAEVSTAIANGDLSKKITVNVSGEILQLKETINTMVDQLNRFAGEVTRVAREVGTEGRLGGQAQVSGVAGTWKDLTDSVNSMASNLTGQVRNIAEVATAVALGDLSKKITVNVSGEILQLKETINTMVDQLNAFASEVTRVAREVGTEGRLGGQAQVPGVAGTWKDLTDSVNSMAGNLTGQVRNIAEVATAIATGDLSRKITVDVRGEILQLKETLNTMVDQLNRFAGEVTRVAREVGTEGKLGGQAQVPGVAGTWKDLTDNVNSMAGNLTAQVRNIAEVTTAVARGDLSRKITVDVKGEILELKNTINTMVDQLNAFASEVTRVAREVGTEGKLGGQAVVPGVGGTWKDLTDNVNFMASNLTGQVRNIAEVATAIANGDLSKKITVDVRGEILLLKETLNTMVDQLRSFAAEVTRVAREVGTEGRLGGQAVVPGVAGTWKDLTDNVNLLAANLTTQVRNIAEVTTAVARGDLSRKITVDVKGEILELKNTINTMVDQLNAFASEVTRVAREVGTEGKLGGQAQVLRRGRDVEGPDRHGQCDGRQPDRAGARHRQSRYRGCYRRSQAETDDELERRGRGAVRDDQQHDRHARHLRRAGDDGRARSGGGRAARRAGERAGCGGDMERSYRQRQSAGGQSHHPGSRHRRSGDRRDQGRPDPLDPGRGARRGGGAERQHQHDDRQFAAHHGPQYRAGLAEDQPRPLHQHAARPARSRRRGTDAAGRIGAAGRSAERRDLSDGRDRAGRRAQPQAARRLCRWRHRRSSRAGGDRRRADRPMRRGRQAAADCRSAGQCRADPLQPVRSDAAQRLRASRAVRGSGEGGDRTGLGTQLHRPAKGVPGATHRQYRHRAEQHRGDDADRGAAEAVAEPRHRIADPAERAAAEERAAWAEGAAARRTERGGGTKERGNRAGPPRAGRKGDRAGADLEIQVRLPRQHVARAAHAAELDPDPGPAAGGQPGRQSDATAGRIRPHHSRRRNRLAEPDQRHPRSVEDRIRHGLGGSGGDCRSPACRRR